MIGTQHAQLIRRSFCFFLVEIQLRFLFSFHRLRKSTNERSAHPAMRLVTPSKLINNAEGGVYSLFKSSYLYISSPIEEHRTCHRSFHPSQTPTTITCWMSSCPCSLPAWSPPLLLAPDLHQANKTTISNCHVLCDYYKHLEIKTCPWWAYFCLVCVLYFELLYQSVRDAYNSVQVSNVFGHSKIADL